MDAQHSPQRFGRYVLLDRMGAGGMAEVFRAVVPGAEGFRRDLVVKRILTDRARTANFIEMFVHEARISALLHHPNVVQVFDFGQVDGSYFLAMELLRGRDLLAVLRSLSERQRPFPIPVAAHVAHQVALGLGYAHGLTAPDGSALNIIHRDVSPSNIMLLRTGGVKLLDFGIAQAIGETDSDESERTSFKGKISYMAPERLRDEPQDRRVDLFALGAVMWEMLAGRRLFHGKTDLEKLRRVLDKPIPPPSSVRADVPEGFDRIVLKALARDRDERYQTGEELADDLEDMVTETKYHSRMLPALLNDLFGSAPSSAHLTLSNAAPELFAFEPLTTPSGTPALVVPTADSLSAPTLLTPLSVPALIVQRVRGLRRSAKMLIAAGLLVSAGATAAMTRKPAVSGAQFGQRAQHVAVEPLPVPTAPAFAGSGVDVSGALAPGTVAAAEIAKAVAATSPASAAGSAERTAPQEPFGKPANVGGSEAIVLSPPSATRAAAQLRPAPRARVTPVTKPAERVRAGRITRGLSIDPFAEAATRGGKR